MATTLRYALTTVCFAPCLGCLALWGWSLKNPQHVLYAGLSTEWIESRVQLWDVVAEVGVAAPIVAPPPKYLWYEFTFMGEKPAGWGAGDNFGVTQNSIYFPLWYPALIFALAGVGVLRFRRQFSIRSIMIATTIVASLIGMAVTL